MKKIYLILFFVILNIGLFSVKIYSEKLKKIEVQVKEEELAIIFLPYQNSDSILLKTKNNHILYVFRYQNDQTLENKLQLFTDQLEYVFTKEEYSLSYPYKVVLDGLIVLQNIQLEPNRIYYHGYTFCLNETENCDFSYLTEEIEIKESVKTIFYRDNLSDEYLEKLHEDWVDFYKITQDNYTILWINDDYKILHLSQ